MNRNVCFHFLYGVNDYFLIEKGTTNGVITDINGKFAISVKAGASLEISCIGYKTVVVAASASMKVTLAEDAEFLNEVVVVGYGTQKKANITGSVATVDVKKTLESKSVTSLGKALQGAVPGLTVTNTVGTINAEPTITIRGIGTLSNSGTSSPLYIVDGVPISSLSYLNTQDIESISVLKDAASTSIYGTRAAFGVVLITTKSAQTNEKVSVSYSNNFGWSQATNLADYDNVENQVTAFNEVNRNIGAGSELFGIYFDSPEYLAAVKSWEQKHNYKKSGYRKMIEGEDFYYNADGSGSYVADWDVVGILFNKATPSQNHTLSVQGTAGKTNYYMSLGYDKEQGIFNFNPDILQKYTATVNVNSQITKWLKVGARVNYMNKRYDDVYMRGMGLTYAWRWGSMFGPWGYFEQADGTKVDGRNLISYRKQGGDSDTVNSNLRIGGFATLTLAKGLTINADYTYTNLASDYKGVLLDTYIYNTWGNIQSPTKMNLATGVETSNSTTTGYVANVYGNYEFNIKENNHFNVMLGFNADESEYNYLKYARKNMADPNLPELILCDAENTYSQSHTSKGSAGFFGRINYNYADKIFLEINGRFDGSSKFPVNHKWAFFPSFSAGWRISQEPWFAPLKSVVNNAKIRASYGAIGNQEIGSNMFISTMSRNTNSVNWLGTGTAKYSYYGMGKLVSSDLSWETIATTNVGLDLGFLNGELNVTFDWFQRDTKGMLAPGQTMPATLGTSAAYENAGSLRSRGWELNVDWHHSFGAVNVYAIGNLSDYKTKVTYWKNDAMQLNTTYTGKTYGDIWGFETAGYFASAADVANSASQTKLQTGKFVFGTGDIKFVDQNGDKVIDWGKGTEADHGDLVKIGNSTPRYQYSLRIGGDWKGFDLDVYFQGVGKRDLWTYSQFVFPYSRGADAIYKGQMSYVTREMIANEKVDQSCDYPRLYAGGGGQGSVSSNIIQGGKFNQYPQTKYILNMAYLRLKNITLGYTIPRNLTEKIKVSKIRVYGAINNAADIINHNRNLGIDPEINAESGVSWGRVDPIMRTYSCGVQITF